MEQGTTHPYVLSVHPLTSPLFAFLSLNSACWVQLVDESYNFDLKKKIAEPALFSLTISFNTFCDWH